jgi:hypothetical protein
VELFICEVSCELEGRDVIGETTELARKGPRDQHPIDKRAQTHFHCA